MDQTDSQSQLFNGWDDTPSYDDSQTNALKYFSDIFQQQIKIQQKQKKNINNNNINNIKNTLTNKFNIATNNIGEEDTNHNRSKENSTIKRENQNVLIETDNKKRQDIQKVMNQLNRENNTYSLHIYSSGIQDACVYETVTNQYQLLNSQYPHNFKTSKNQFQEQEHINNNQIFMKKNIFQDKSQRNAQFDLPNSFYYTNSFRNHKNQYTQQYQHQNSLSSEGRQNVQTKLSDKQFKNRNNESLNLGIYQSNHDSKINYNYQKNFTIENIEFDKTSENQRIQNHIGVNAISITQQSQQSENGNTYSTLDNADTETLINRINKKKQGVQDQSSLNNQFNNFFLKDFCSQAQVKTINEPITQENNQFLLQTNNMQIVTPEKFIPFYQQEQNSILCCIEQRQRNKSLNNSSRKDSKINSNNIVKTEGDSRQKTNERLNIRDTTDSQLSNDITTSFRQRQQSLSMNKNQMKNTSNDQLFYDEAKKDLTYENNETQTIKHPDYSRQSRPLTVSKLQNYKRPVQSSSPSNNMNILNNAQEQSDDINQVQQMENQNDEQKEKEDFNFSAFIYGKIDKYQNKNSSNEKISQISQNKIRQKENTQQNGQQTKYRETQKISKKLNHLVAKLNTDQTLSSEAKQDLNQSNELFPYNGVFNLTNTQFNQPKKNKSFDLETNQVVMGDNLFYYYQKDKFPLLKFKRKNQNEFLKLINKKIITQKQQINDNISKEKLNITSGTFRQTLFDTFQKQQTNTENSPSNSISNCITPVSKNQINSSYDQRINTAGDCSRQKYLKNNTRQQYEKNTPIKLNKTLNQTFQNSKVNCQNNKQIDQKNNLTFQYGNISETTNITQNHQNNQVRQHTIQQNIPLAFTLNTENMQNNSSLNNSYQHQNIQNEYNNSLNETYSTLRKNKLRIFQHNYMFKINQS